MKKQRKLSGFVKKISCWNTRKLKAWRKFLFLSPFLFLFFIFGFSLCSAKTNGELELGSFGSLFIFALTFKFECFLFVDLLR